MNIHISDKMVYYLPIIFELGDVNIKNGKQFFNKMKSISRSKLLESCKQTLKKSFKFEEAISLALYYAVYGDVLNCTHYLRLIQQKNGVSQTAEVVRCLLYCETNRFDEALQVIKNLPVEIIKIPIIFKLKADIYFDMEEYGKSEQLYKKVIGKVPYQSSIYSRLGEIYLLKSQIKIAGDFFIKAIKLDNRNIMAHLYLGDVYKLKGDVENAKKEYGICAAVDFKNDFSKMAQQKLLLLCFEKTS